MKIHGMPDFEIHDEIVRRIGRLADALGLEVYLVGGAVRDGLMRRRSKDIDITVVGDGIRFGRRVHEELRTSVPVEFDRFGTSRLMADGIEIEFVGTRKETYEEDSRKPTVAEGSIDDDLLRRDFTVNAMAVRLNARGFGELLDPFDGQGDIERRLLRTPVDPLVTFTEDPLRMIRAFRFASQLDFRIDPDVLVAVRQLNERILIVSMERIRDEFLKILASPKPSIGLAPMMENGLIAHFFPELHALAGVDQRSIEYPDGVKNFHHKDVFYHTLRVVDNLAKVSDSLWLRMSALLHDIAKPQTKYFHPETGWTFHGHAEIGARRVKRIFRVMKLPFEAVHFVEKMVALHLRPIALVNEGVTDSAIRRLLFDAGEDIDDLIMLCRADITSKNPRLVERYLRNYENLVLKMKDVEDKDKLRTWQPPLRGEEIMQICGIPSGIMVGIIKTRIEDAILDGLIPNERHAAEEFLLSIKDEVLKQPAIKKDQPLRGRLKSLPEGLQP